MHVSAGYRDTDNVLTTISLTGQPVEGYPAAADHADVVVVLLRLLQPSPSLPRSRHGRSVPISGRSGEVKIVVIVAEISRSEAAQIICYILQWTYLVVNVPN